MDIEVTFPAGSAWMQASTGSPCVHRRYSDLLEHPKKGDNEYRKNATSGSILYPMIAPYAALYDIDELYQGVANFKKEHLEHCNFQFWFPDETSEAMIYKNSDVHGATASHVGVHRTKQEFIKEVFDECEQSPHFKELSAVKYGMWPIIIVACRHFRLPVPLHLLESILKSEGKATGRELFITRRHHSTIERPWLGVSASNRFPVALQSDSSVVGQSGKSRTCEAFADYRQGA